MSAKPAPSVLGRTTMYPCSSIPWVFIVTFPPCLLFREIVHLRLRPVGFTATKRLWLWFLSLLLDSSTNVVPINHGDCLTNNAFRHIHYSIYVTYPQRLSTTQNPQRAGFVGSRYVIRIFTSCFHKELRRLITPVPGKYNRERPVVGARCIAISGIGSSSSV